MRFTSSHRGYEHHISIPHHNPLRVGTLNGILGDVADYLGVDLEVVVRELFGA